VTREEALEHAAQIVQATDLPVTADLENGFADEPAGVAETVRLAAGAGLAGCSVEDFSGRADAPIHDPSLAAARVEAAAEAAHRTLGQWSRSGSIRAALAERAKILLLAAQGVSNTEITQQVGCSRPTVILWRRRYSKAGLDGLGDQPRPGRPQTVRRDRCAEILAATLTPPPEHLGVTNWSTRLLATELGVSHNTVARVWKEHDLKPWQTERFKFSTDPELEAKVRDVVGLYLDRCHLTTTRHDTELDGLAVVSSQLVVSTCTSPRPRRAG
jgi:transposase